MRCKAKMRNGKRCIWEAVVFGYCLAHQNKLVKK